MKFLNWKLTMPNMVFVRNDLLHTLIIKHIINRAERAGKPGHVFFIDWEQAIDKVRVEKLIEILIGLDVDSHLIKLIQLFYNVRKKRCGYRRGYFKNTLPTDWN